MIWTELMVLQEKPFGKILFKIRRYSDEEIFFFISLFDFLFGMSLPHNIEYVKKIKYLYLFLLILFQIYELQKE